MKFKKTHSSYSVNIYECEVTKMKIELRKFEKIYIVIDKDNCYVWEFKTLKEAKQAAHDWINSEDIF